MRMRYFKFYGEVSPEGFASHFHWTLSSEGGLKIDFTGRHVTVRTPALDLDENPFDRGVAVVEELLDRAVAILALVAEQPYHAHLVSWQEFEADTNIMTISGNIVHPAPLANQVKTLPNPFVLPIDSLEADSALRESLLDFRTALERPSDALVYLWRAVERLHNQTRSLTSQQSRDFANTDTTLGLDAGSLKSLYDRANDPQLGQRHIIGIRVPMEPAERERWFELTRQVIVSYSNLARQMRSA